MSDPFTIRPARYSKGLQAVTVAGDGFGFMTRAQRVADHFARRYTHRENAYIMSAAAVSKMRAAYDAGRDASPFTGELR